jgi:glyoxylase-like metal-dependent hydrolase (beta-lactamase superfamily II)
MDATECEPVGRGTSTVRRLEFDVDWPPWHVAAYLIEGPEPILVDAATPEDEGAAAMRELLGEAGYELADVSAVVVTHPHTDHMGQVPQLREAGVDVYAPEPALDQLRRDAEDLRAGVRETGRSIGLEDDRLDEEAERAVHSLTRNRRLLDPFHTTGFHFGEPVEIAGRTFDPIHTPGHQLHHASLATEVDGERVLFSGDTLIEPFRAAALNVGIDYGAYEAIDAFYTSMDRYEAMDVDRVYPGHGPVFADYAGAIESSRTALDELVEDTREAVATVGPATPMDIVDERVGETDHPAQLLDTLGALGTLDRRGAVTFSLRDGVRYYETA